MHALKIVARRGGRCGDPHGVEAENLARGNKRLRLNMLLSALFNIFGLELLHSKE